MDCHLQHESFGNHIETLAGNANLCLGCHQVGGLASAHAMAEGQQARLGPAVADQMPSRGCSHRWDATAAGRVESLSEASAAGIQPGGDYTGSYAVSYTLTIVTVGPSGTARFNWNGLGPGAGAVGGVLTGTNVPLEAGLTVSFLDEGRAGGFQVGDQWRIHVRPGLRLPVNPDLLRNMPGGKVICSTCHESHFQFMEPFDPQAPAYAEEQGAGRHFLRVHNDTDQMCTQCHAGLLTTNAQTGTHVVGVWVGTNALLHPPATLPMDKHEGRMWCSTCHQVHNSPGNDGQLLRTAGQQTLCVECHALTHASASHLGGSTGVLWPGGQYGSLLPADLDPAHRGSCGNCHRVHGWPDGSNPGNHYASLLVEREENLCYTCHDGSPLTLNLRAEFSKPYTHPAALSGRHRAAEGGDPENYGTANRHAECEDCHNPHQLAGDPGVPAAPLASAKLRGVPRLSVQNVSRTTVNYIYRGPDDPTVAREYEVCFTCHSGWTSRPAGRADYALEFNTLNASFHPVESLGKNLRIHSGAFVNGWNARRMMRCTDCHASDDPGVRGPHGSSYPYLLKQLAIASPARRSTVMSRDELCFDCHNYDTYANNNSSSTVKNYSRFGSNHGHAYHVGSRRYSCYTCHATHGAANQPSLLVTGRSPGIRTYTPTANGGTCAATCHGSEGYSIAYPR